MKKIFLTTLFFLFTPLTLFLGLFALWQTESQSLGGPKEKVFEILSPLELYSALPPNISFVSYHLTTGEARPIIIEQYLEKHQSPIAPYANLIFQISQNWGLDYRLMIAISQCESNLCKKIPSGSYNCWGFENGETRFLSWEQAFNQVAKTLKEGYIDKGLVTPEQIMPKYAPPSVEKGGPWAKCVNQFLGELE